MVNNRNSCCRYTCMQWVMRKANQVWDSTTLVVVCECYYILWWEEICGWIIYLYDLYGIENNFENKSYISSSMGTNFALSCLQIPSNTKTKTRKNHHSQILLISFLKVRFPEFICQHLQTKKCETLLNTVGGWEKDSFSDFGRHSSRYRCETDIGYARSCSWKPWLGVWLCQCGAVWRVCWQENKELIW